MKQNTWFHLSLSLVLCQQYSRFTGSYERYFLLILVDTCLVILHKYLKLLFSVLPCNVLSYDFIDLITIYFKHFFTTTVVNYSINFPAMRLSTTTLSSVKHSGFIMCYRLFCTEQWRWQRIPSPYFPTSFLLSQHWHFNISTSSAGFYRSKTSYKKPQANNQIPIKIIQEEHYYSPFLAPHCLMHQDRSQLALLFTSISSLSQSLLLDTFDTCDMKLIIRISLPFFTNVLRFLGTPFVNFPTDISPPSTYTISFEVLSFPSWLPIPSSFPLSYFYILGLFLSSTSGALNLANHFSISFSPYLNFCCRW